ncbi:MAG: DUF3619 family protein [Rhodocyclaceae bacterium]|nr:DUF3619 family protein [Rhodocyclaceae bacterium]MBX3667435.1 DUF3619 family protein [Rhodocyclaceae bacterium]
MNEAEFARGVRRALDDACAELPRDVTEKLFRARQLALARHPALQAELAFAGPVSGGREVSRRNRLAVWLLALVVAGAAVGTSYWRGLQRSADAEEVDTSLLADDLPIAAYLDSGFDTWLKSNTASSQR